MSKKRVNLRWHRSRSTPSVRRDLLSRASNIPSKPISNLVLWILTLAASLAAVVGLWHQVRQTEISNVLAMRASFAPNVRITATEIPEERKDEIASILTLDNLDERSNRITNLGLQSYDCGGTPLVLAASDEGLSARTLTQDDNNIVTRIDLYKHGENLGPNTSVNYSNPLLIPVLYQDTLHNTRADIVAQSLIENDLVLMLIYEVIIYQPDLVEMQPYLNTRITGILESVQKQRRHERIPFVTVIEPDLKIFLTNQTRVFVSLSDEGVIVGDQSLCDQN